jgi:hypothetical protein
VLADRGSVDTAQRGWLTSDDVINTWPLSRLCASPAQRPMNRPSDGAGRAVDNER